jgi:hypothetical protein
MAYRKLPGRLHQWHNNPRCPDWPVAEYLEQDEIPEDRDICPKCRALNKVEGKEPQ